MQTLDGLLGCLRPQAALSPRKRRVAALPERWASPERALDGSAWAEHAGLSAAVHTLPQQPGATPAGRSAGLSAMVMSPLPIEVSASAAPLAPPGPGRAGGLSQWAIALGSPGEDNAAPSAQAAGSRGMPASSPGGALGAGPGEGAPPEPVTASEKKPADKHLMGTLSIAANSDHVVPWVRNMEIAHGVVYSGFLDDDGFPDLFGCIKYYGASPSTVDGPGGAFRVHVITQHSSAPSWGYSGMQVDKTARQLVRPASALPSVVTHTVHRASPATSGMPAQAVYVGELHKGRRHGLGRIKYLAGTEYAGTWEHDQMQGVGVMRQRDGSRYYGTVVRKRFHGYGLLITRAPKVDQDFLTTEGLFTDGRSDICAILGHMPSRHFQISRNSFVSLNLGRSAASQHVLRVSKLFCGQARKPCIHTYTHTHTHTHTHTLTAHIHHTHCSGHHRQRSRNTILRSKCACGTGSGGRRCLYKGFGRRARRQLSGECGAKAG
jgi:hypothetical protein